MMASTRYHTTHYNTTLAAKDHLESSVDQHYADVVEHATYLENFRDMYNHCASWTKLSYRMKRHTPDSLVGDIDMVRRRAEF
jgi:hypothetical protein